MGTSASLNLPESLTEAEVRELAGSRFDRDVFLAHCDLADGAAPRIARARAARPRARAAARAARPEPRARAARRADGRRARRVRGRPARDARGAPIGRRRGRARARARARAGRPAQPGRDVLRQRAALRALPHAVFPPRDLQLAPAGRGARRRRRARHRRRADAAAAAAAAARARDSIPFQLQALFARMQLGRARACSTTGLTAAFQWERQAGLQQHDVQELCRLLFDAPNARRAAPRSARGCAPRSAGRSSSTCARATRRTTRRRARSRTSTCR